MRKQLLDLSRHLRKMQESASPAYVVKDVRNTQLAKIMDARRDRKEQLLKDCAAARESLKAIWADKKLPPIEATARYMELDQRYSAAPLADLKKIDPGPLDYDEMRALASTLRKRGAHDDADNVHHQLQIKQQGYLGMELWKEIGKTEARVTMLLGDQDPSSIWIGSDLMDIQKDDFATIQDDGLITFKDKDQAGNLITVVV